MSIATPTIAALVFIALSLPGFAQEAKPEAPLRFEIQRFQVEGNTFLTPPEVQKTLAPFVGKDKDFGDVQRSLEALQKAYVDKGYSAVQVLLPEQELEQGIIQFKVIEARFGKVTVQGNLFFDDANIRASLPQIKEGDPPNATRIAESLRVANENPAKQTTVILKSADEEGIIDATIRVEDEKQWKASLTFDNTGNQPTGPYRLGAGYRNANFFNRDHVLTLQYITSPEKIQDVNVFGVGYKIPLYSAGDSVEAFAGHSDVDSGVVQDLFNISGKGTIFGLRYNQLLRKIGEFYEHKLIYAWDYRAFQNRVVPVGATINFIPDVTIRPVSLTYFGQWRYPASEANFYATYAQNIPGGNDGAGSDLQNSRIDARGAYRILRLGGAYNKVFGNDWITRVAANAQLSDDALVSGEQFGLGGAENIRGFLEREVANDKGYRGSIEVYTPDLARLAGWDNSRVRVLGFWDFGGVERNSVQPGEKPSEFVSGVGLGLRFAWRTDLSLRLDFAEVRNSGGGQGKGDGRAHFSLSLIF